MNINGVSHSECFLNRKHKKCYAIVCVTYNRHNEYYIVGYESRDILDDKLSEICYSKKTENITARILVNCSRYEYAWKIWKELSMGISIERLMVILRNEEM